MDKKCVVLLFCIAIFALSACGPKSLPPILENGAVNEETKRQQEAILKDYLDRLAKVDRVAFPLLTRNLVACEDYQFLSGALILDRGEVYRPYREAATIILGMDDKPRIMSLVAKAPAEKAGLQVGDVILSINGQSVSSASAAISKLRKNRMVKIKVQRGAQQVDADYTQDRACAYPIELKEEPILNAYAFGDRIWVTTGMVKFTKSDDELALILGHELAHNTMNHLGARRDNMRIGSLLLDMPIAVFTGVNPGIGSAMGAAAYSQDFESEADYVGMYNTTRAGFDISGVSDLWRRMAIENPGAVYTSTTHPTTANRFVALEAIRKEIEAKKAAGQPLEPNAKPQ